MNAAEAAETLEGCAEFVRELAEESEDPRLWMLLAAIGAVGEWAEGVMKDRG